MTTSENTNYLSLLNPPQREAVEHFLGPILVLAGAGSGKTRVLTNRVAHLVLEHEVDPRRILAVTFTNKAANEMKERLESLLGPRTKALWVSTFHSFCLRVLRRHADRLDYKSNFVVYDSQDSKALFKQLLKQHDIDTNKYPVQFFRSRIDSAKNEYISAEDYAKRTGQNAGEKLVAEIYDSYQRNLLASNAMDFGDLLVNCLRLLSEHSDLRDLYQRGFQFVLVDEFQDTNYVQYQIVKTICDKHHNLLVVGDDDQSIYAFRGANIQNILNFEKDFPETKLIKLEQNYRSTATILDAAHAVIEKNTGRKAKKLWTEDVKGEAIASFCGSDETEEAEYVAGSIDSFLKNGIAHSEIAIFYRTNAQSRALEEALMKRGITYRIYGGLKFYDRKEVKDLLAYLKLLHNEDDGQSFLRVINNPPRGIGAQTVQNIVKSASYENISLYESAKRVAETNKKVAAFVEMFEKWKAEVSGTALWELVGKIGVKSGYRKRLEDSKDPTAQSRLENLQELQAIAATVEAGKSEDSPALEQFLDRVSLSAGNEIPEKEQDGSEEAKDTEFVSLSTLHLAKGLEFPVVFLTGLEEGLLPHNLSMQEHGGIEEERRLCYVGITRAMKELHITRAQRRGMFSSGDFGMGGQFREPSRYALDIPQSLLKDSGKDFFANPYFEGNVVTEIIPEFDTAPDEPLWLSKKKKRKKKKKLVGDLLLSSADSIVKQDKADANSLSPGARVSHPSFGSGIVEKTEGEPAGDPKKFKLLIRFDEYETPKKLIYKFAHLSLRD